MPQKHIKIEFTRCPGQDGGTPCSLPLSTFPRPGNDDVAPANDIRATPVADAFTTDNLGKKKDSARHLSLPRYLPFAEGKKANEKKRGQDDRGRDDEDKGE